MANLYWLGHAVAVSQVKTHTVSGATSGDVYKATMNGKDVTYTVVGGDTNDTVAAALQTLLGTTTITEFTEATWTVATNVVTSTTVAGEPVDITTSVTGTGTFVTATVTAATGPNWWTDTDNWSTGALPANGDSVYLRGTSTDILYGLAQSAVTLALLDIDSTYTGKIGLPDYHGAAFGGNTGYAEYRATYLAIGATATNVGRGTGQGSGLLRINYGSVQNTSRVYGTGQPTTTGGVVYDFLGTHASNAIYASRGSIGVAIKPGTTSTVANAYIGSQGSAVSDVQCVFGDGATLANIKMTGGTVEVRNGFTTGTITAGELTVSGTAGVATSLIALGGTVNYDSSGTIASYFGGTESRIDFSRVVVARTVTAAELIGNCDWIDPGKVVAVSGSGIRVRCKLSELRNLDIGEDFYLQRA